MKTVAERISILEKLKNANTLELQRSLAGALKDKSPTVRGFVVEVIGEKKIDKMLVDLLPMLKDSDSEVRMLAIESIGKLADGKLYADNIVESLKDKSELVRIAAAEILGELGSPIVLDNLKVALNDKSELVRSYAAEAIGSIGQQESIETLEAYLLNEDNENAKVGFYVGLYKLNKKDVLEKLLSLFESKDYRVRCATANSLSILNLTSSEISQVISVLKQALDKEKTVAARSSIENTLTYLQS